MYSSVPTTWPKPVNIVRSVNGWLVVDAASPAKADEVLELLSKTLDDLPL